MENNSSSHDVEKINYQKTAMITDFLRDCTVSDKESRVYLDRIYGEYLDYCQRKKLKYQSIKEMERMLRYKGHTANRVKFQGEISKRYKGLRIVF